MPVGPLPPTPRHPYRTWVDDEGPVGSPQLAALLRYMEVGENRLGRWCRMVTQRHAFSAGFEADCDTLYWDYLNAIRGLEVEKPALFDELLLWLTDIEMRRRRPRR